jgi:hypothetical protein
MYVFISFVFFLLFSYSSSSELDKEHPVQLDQEDIAELKQDHPLINIDSIIGKRTLISKDTTIRLLERKLYDSIQNLNKKKKKNNGFSIVGDKYESLVAYDSTQNVLPADKRDGWFMRRLNIRAVELNKRYENRSDEFGKEFGKAFLDNFSKVLFFLLPVFALLLKLFYIRKDYFYSEHLVFSIYYYNFFYLAGSVQLLCGYLEHIPVFGWIRTIIGFWIFLYLLVAMKRMYNQSWKKTTLKFFIFSLLFMICIGIGFTINALFLVFVI